MNTLPKIWQYHLINSFTKEKIEKVLENKNILPPPNKIFAIFNLLLPTQIRVVILGQDPYHSPNQANGLSFSVNKNIPIPCSLKNIYANLLKYNHIPCIPTHGDLTDWVYQGCFLLNTALTVLEKKPGVHTNDWIYFTDNVIKTISDMNKNVVFVLWGKHAFSKLHLIDQTKHKIIISSHPSGYSCNNKLMNYPSFNDNDHFGQINNYLIENNFKPINWQIY